MPTTRPDNRYRVVTAIIPDRRDRILVICRSRASTSFIGAWQLPEGKVRPGEADVAALRREIREELGCRLVLSRRLLVTTVIGQRRGRSVAVTRHVFRSRLAGELSLSADHTAARWIGKDDWHALRFVPGTKRILHIWFSRTGGGRGEARVADRLQWRRQVGSGERRPGNAGEDDRAFMIASSPLGEFLKNFRWQFEPALDRYLNTAIHRLRRINPQGAELGNVIRNFTTRSGKRMRAALVLLGYELAGWKSTTRILQPAIAIELLHSFFLIHDDIIDQSPLRRGKPTVHEHFAQRYEKKVALRVETSKNLGSSLAIITGDLCFSLALAALLDSEFPDDRIRAASAYFLRATDATIIGQALDMILPLKRKVSEREAMSVLRLKTANYSVFAPLALGMTLAGARPALLKQIERYAIPVGVAFQIRDDILGVFGSARKLGKPVTSDLEEGKQTLLVVYARERATPAQRRRLDTIVGKKRLTSEEMNEARRIFQDTGALRRCEQHAKRLVEGAQQHLTSMRIPRRTQRLLFEFGEFIITRTT